MSLPTHSEKLVQELLALPSRARQRRFLAKALSVLDARQVDDLGEMLKEQVVQNLSKDIPLAQQSANLILDLARRTGSEPLRALGLRARAQVLGLGLGEYRKALRLYRQALSIHRRNHDRLGEALVYLSSIWSMANLGQVIQALAAGQWAGPVLKEYQQWRAYATLQTNLAAIYNHSYQFQRALDCAEECSRVLAEAGETSRQYLSNSEINRAMALCSLGRFSESLQASQSALELARLFDQKIAYARAQHDLAITYFLMGRYNPALDLLLQAHDAHTSAGQAHEAALCDLTSTECLLVLNRWEAAAEKCSRVMAVFTQLEMRQEAAEAAHNQATAYLHLGRAREAVSALQTVREFFSQENLPHWSARTDLEIARALLQDGQTALALETAQRSTASLQGLGLPYESVQANLLVARARRAVGDLPGAQMLIETCLAAMEAEDWPALWFEGHLLLAQLRLAGGCAQAALEQYTRAVDALERLRSQVMLEYRGNFLLEREMVYPEVISLCLDLGKTDQALEFAERARSRALVELLSGRADLSLRARQPGDEPLIARIQQLQSERQMYARLLDTLALDPAARSDEEIRRLETRLLELEKDITALWHNLIIRNTAYQQAADRWEVPPARLSTGLAPGSLLLEYFTLADSLVLFLVHADREGETGRIEALRLPAPLREVERLLQLLQLNLQSVPVSGEQSRPFLTANARALLQRLYDLLLAPAAAALAGCDNLVIVPHGQLHYLPFHALFDGSQYLIQTHAVRYQPSMALLQRSPRAAVAAKMLVAGHSYGQRLPGTLQEAASVAALWNGQALLEDQATLENIRAQIATSTLIHLACHGDFRPDNPLFSGLALADGWLTTLDFFNMHLDASLVTLSACQTGRGVLGGGDEWTGLMRALLSAGAASLVLSQWTAADDSTARLMEIFYLALANGQEKSAALRQAQVSLLAADPTGHPYFWAPFFLAGDDGIL